jgi:anti-sigma B factor antagonist
MSEHIEVVDDGLTLVSLGGELDAHDAPRLRETFAQALERAPGGAPVVLDLAQVSFLDSTALGSIVGLLRRVREAGGDLRVVLPSGPALRIFEITGLDAVLTTYPTRAAALAG